MRTIVLTYPGFASLPRGIKQLLVASENFFFDEARPAASRPGATRPPAGKNWCHRTAENQAGFKPLPESGFAAGSG